MWDENFANIGVEQAFREIFLLSKLYQYSIIDILGLVGYVYGYRKVHLMGRVIKSL